MDWADELAAQVRDRGPQVVNDSKTPSGTVHVGSLRGPGHPRHDRPRAARERHRDDVPLRRRRPRPDGRPGAPDARRDRDRDGPAARPRPRPGRRRPRVVRPAPRRDLHRHLRRSRHPSGPLLLDERHLPDRRDGPVHPDGARPGRHVVRDIYRRVANVQHPDTWHPFNVICPTCGKVGTTIVTEWDGEQVYYECRPNLVTWATGCGSSGWISPFGGTGKLVWNVRVGGPVVAVRRDHRAVRQGPLDRGRLARPLRRDRPRGVRARAAAQRRLRVPQHRRQEDVDLEGPRRRGAHDRRGHPARAAPVPLPAPEAEPRDRLRSRRHRPDPAAVRRVRQVRGRDRRPRGQGRAAARLTRPRSATRCSTPTRTSPPRRRPSGRPSRISRSCSRSRASMSRPGSRRRRGVR